MSRPEDTKKPKWNCYIEDIKPTGVRNNLIAGIRGAGGKRVDEAIPFPGRETEAEPLAAVSDGKGRR